MLNTLSEKNGDWYLAIAAVGIYAHFLPILSTKKEDIHEGLDEALV